MAVTALLRLSKLTGNQDLADRAAKTLQWCADAMLESPMGYGQMLAALDFQLGPVDEIAIVGPGKDPETQAVLRTLHYQYRPNKVFGFLDTDLPDDEKAARVNACPLLSGKTAVTGRVTTYVCRNFTCADPTVGMDGAASGD